MSSTFSNKPRLYEKIVEVSRGYTADKHSQKEFKPYGFVLNYSNSCNFSCKHCFTKSGSGDISESKLTMDDLKSLSHQADELGVYELDIQGGEPLSYPNLFDVLEALDPGKFYTYLTSNAWLLTQELADKVAAAGVDRITISIDSFDAKEHDDLRQQQGSYKKAMESLEYVAKAGMRPYVNITVGNYNARDKKFLEFCESLLEKKYGVAYNCAIPVGDWQNNYDVMLTPEDTIALEDFRKKHPQIIRDLWNYFDKNAPLVRGCPIVNLFYVNPLGDVLPCPYVQAKIGNIMEQPLKEILEYGFTIGYFNTFSEKCLAGEDVDFAKKYLGQKTSVLNPMSAQEYFNIK